MPELSNSFYFSIPEGLSMLRNAFKAKTTAGFRRAVRDLAEEFRVQRLHRAALRRAHRYSTDNLKLNAGCGRNFKDGWINIDMSDKADLQLDLREPLPFAAESVSIVYSEHFLEHLEYPDQALNFLKESLRVLQPGGLFSVGVPDTEWPLKSYVNEDQEYFLLARQRWHPAWCNTRMHNLNYHFRQGRQHKYAYDFETLAQILGEVGFVSIARRAFNPGLDDERREHGTLYVDAYKPTSALNPDTRPRAG
ncbi:MAG TPA: methyltransferase domain-containing protein [Candidatus Binatia bacterium]